MIVDTTAMQNCVIEGYYNYQPSIPFKSGLHNYGVMINMLREASEKSSSSIFSLWSQGFTLTKWIHNGVIIVDQNPRSFCDTLLFSRILESGGLGG